ncbi:ATP-binding protein [Myxococcus sp. AB025B]|uniref:GAF domain-containing sensor histidine kinase n=1 Tax=Myxococcus sp. AB025B TaxID=2562794 RepID=UPI001144B417|nr:ATP-binding protein [Myxococcus sp. AB025B]
MNRIADIIHRHYDAIVRLWTEEATRAASARGLDAPELKNIMPTYLASLAEDAKAPATTFAERRKYVEGHVAARLRQGFHVAEVVEEFALLGRCISRMWAEAPPQARPDVEDVERLLGELHAASASVIALFSEHMREDEQAEKRYLRLIQKVANEALEVDAASLQERLREVLELIMEALGGQGAALLLKESLLPGLGTVVSTGVAMEALARYATTRGVLDEGPGSGEEAEATPMAVSEDLRREGLSSLLGIRLATHYALRGVLYVGVAASRDFTARERRRLESLGERLTIHLDNAKLHADLLAKVETLQEERVLRERFVSVLAHDLRGPLSAAKVAAQLLLRRPEMMEERRDLARRIDQNIERTDRMVRDLLDANRLRAGEQLSLQFAPCDLRAIAREVIEELSTIHGERFLLVAEAPVEGFWSEDELRRALWNLTSNAVKYGASDSPVTLTVARTASGARVSVHNEGRVLSQADQDLLFKPFSRTRSAREGPSKGWGLGLTLVWGCAQAHGGRVSIESGERTGTTFTLELPLDSRAVAAVVA